MFSRLLNWFTTTRLWVKLARHTIAHFTFRLYGYPKFPMEKYFEIKKIIDADPNAMYAFVSADTDSLAWRLTYMMTKADWGHAGFIVKEGEHLRAWHMKGNGMNKWHLLELLKEADDFAVVKLPLSGDNLLKAQARFKTIQQFPLVRYDFQLEIPAQMDAWLDGIEKPLSGTRSLKLYCSEFVYVVGHGLVDDVDFQAHWRYGLLRFEPDDVYKGGSVVHEYRHRRR